MLAALFLSALAVGPAPAAAPPNDPPIELWINNDRRFMPGENVQVQVRTQEDGYLLVLHADPDGRVHVLFPIDPDDDNFVHGGKRYEIRGRADREAFEASITGHGTVYAAISHDPFEFDRYNSGNHWDYRALAPDRLSRDPEAELTELVRGMARSNFDYDVLGYDVIERVYAPYYRPYRHWAVDPFCDPLYYDYFCRPYYGHGSYLSVSLTFGRPYGYYYGGYDPFYDPYYYHHYRPAYAYPYYYPYYSSYWYSPRRPYNGPTRVRGQFVFDNYRDRRNSVGRPDGYHWPLVRTRDGGVPSRRVVDRTDGAAAPVARPAIDRRPAGGRAVDARPADRGVGRRPDDRGQVEAHRARPRDGGDAPRARPNIESRPAGRPEGRRVERGGNDAPREERPQPETRPSRRDDAPREEPRAEPRRRDDGDRGDAPERRGGGDDRPADRGDRGGGWGGGGGRRR